VTVLGLRRAGGDLIVGPREDVRLEEGDRLIVAGPEGDITALNERPEGRTANV
jgi:uncharacterized protein with PhoU and TrkA domain